MNKKRLLLISNCSAIVWAICVLSVVIIIAIASKFATHDPDFSPGKTEYIYLFPMLSFFFLGIASFGVMFLSGLLFFFKKGETAEYKAPLGLSFKKVFLFIGIIFFGLFSFLFAYRQRNMINPEGKYTGQEVFDAVNRFREQNGKHILVIEPALCDNLVQRYLDIKNPDKQYEGHPGFVRWVETEGLTNYILTEVYVEDTNSPEDAINFW
ncbi:hypothetical protein MUP56_01325, partial [Patescibacteria group bacterium]|nr:hypothetical protein [Patescibacteria group bacterium]